MPSVGRISIKGIVGPAIETDLDSLNIKPTPTDSDCINIAPPLTEVFAVCDELNDETAEAITDVDPVTPKTVNPVDLRADADDDRDCIDATNSSHAETDLKSADTATLIK